MNTPYILFFKPYVYHLADLPEDFILIGDEHDLMENKKHTITHIRKAIANSVECAINKYGRKNVVIITGRFSDIPVYLKRGILGKNTPPMILTNIEWLWRYRSSFTLKGICNKWVHHIIGRGANIITTFCDAEIVNYSKAYNIPASRFRCLPYCSICDEETSTESKDIYLFSGGSYDRDYNTLFQAIRGLPVNLKLATLRKNLGDISIPDNVDVLGRLTFNEYKLCMVNSQAVVLALDSTSSQSALRYPGISTYVMAMRMRKCIIVNEPMGAASYIRNCQDGILTPPNDPIALREAICRVLDDQQYRQRLADSAYERSHAEFGPERYFSDLRAMACQLFNDRK